MGDTNAVDVPEPPVAGTEAETLLGSVNRQRTIFEWKVGDLDADGMHATLAPSTMTLGGLVKHLALVEDEYLSHRLLGVALDRPWTDADFESDPDWEWHSAAGDSPAQLMALWHDAVARSRAAVRRALEHGDIDQPSRFTSPDGRTPTLRRLLIDLVEEYARHVGHADLIRESIDGLVGEDPRD